MNNEVQSMFDKYLLIFLKSAFLKLYETTLELGIFWLSVLMLNEIKLWSHVFVNGKLINRDVILSKPKWLQINRSRMFPFLWVGFSITWVKKLSVQKSRKNSWDSLKSVLGIVQSMFGRLKSPRTKKE